MITPPVVVPSPCINVCRLNGAQVCVGCGRNIDEIMEWPSASDARKREIVAVSRRRLPLLGHLPPRPTGPST